MNRTGVALLPRDRRALLAGSMAISLLLVVGRAGPAWRRWQQAEHGRAGRATRDLAREEGVLRTRRRLRDSLADRQRRLRALASAWLDGDSPAAAGAALAGLVSSAAKHAEMTIHTLDIQIDTVSQAAFIPVRVHATAIGDIHGVATLLTTFEQGPTRLVVSALSVQSTDPAAAPDRPEVLRAEFVVQGAWRRPAGAMSP